MFHVVGDTGLQLSPWQGEVTACRAAGPRLRKVHEVLEARVEVRLLSQSAHALEVRVVNVRVHPEETLEDCPDYIQEVGRKLDAILLREDGGFVKLRHTHARALFETLREVQSPRRTRVAGLESCT